ncbi:hypothetical protein [uncultured Aquimarina sp.]|uniref:hypothetical protein n=1 Tax=uncultured Aquimarina sp. TaxID=575652 RepID=UPI002606C1B6|nr:hypothetical protein [uncultured Aquimarina sp.]
MTHLKRLTLLIALLVVQISIGQEYFEGELFYSIQYEPINKSIPVEYLEKEMGTSFSAYVQEDRYAMIYHAEGTQGWMKIIVALKEGYSYTEYEKSDTIIKTKFGTEKEELVEFKRNTDKKEVLNELCESVTINYKPLEPDAYVEMIKGTYYFNPKYKLNAKFYKNYTDGFWNLFVNEAKSISIRNETEFYPLFKTIQEVTLIEEKKIPDEVFELNASKVIFEKK